MLSTSALAADEDEPVRHPLMSEDAVRILGEHPELSPEELWSRMWVHEGVTEEADHSERWVSTAELTAPRVASEDRPVPEGYEHLAPVDVEVAPGRRVPLSVDDTVAGWLADAASEEPVEVLVVFDRGGWDDTVSVMYQHGVAMLAGDVQVRADLDRVRLDTLAERARLGAAAMAEVEALIASEGGEVLYASHTIGTLRASLAPATLARLADRPEVARLQEPGVSEDDGVGHAMTIDRLVDGLELADWLQTNPLYNHGYDGAGEASVVTEKNADNVHDAHASFQDASGTSSRFLNCQGTTTTCTYATVTYGDAHPTSVASVILSDLTDGQDAAITDPDEQAKRSGIVRNESTLGIGISDVDLQRMVDIATGGANVHLISQSASRDFDDPQCLGADGRSVTANAAFEGGVAYIKSAGNNGHDDPDDCRVGSPAAAIGVFPTAAIKLLDPEPPHSTETFEHDAGTTALGGTSVEGLGRTIIGVGSLTGHTLRAEDADFRNPQYTSNAFGQTSGATPVTTGAAELFRDWYLDKRGTLIDDPGILYANLLLMGDTTSQLTTSITVPGQPPNPLPQTYTVPSEAYQSIGFSNLLGAGRLRLRTYGAAGIDGPGGYRTGAGCLGDLATHTIDVNDGDPLPAGVDYIKVVTWWYDHDHDDPPGGWGHDWYQLELQRWDPSTSTWEVVLEDDSQDNRQRLVFSGDGLSDGGDTFRVQIHGVWVTSDGEGCGTNANRVHYAMLWEDNARDDGGDHTTYVRPHPGVAP